MNLDGLDGKWRQLRGQVKDMWNDMSDRELDQVAGQYDSLLVKLQEKYGYSRRQAEAELAAFLSRRSVHQDD